MYRLKESGTLAFNYVLKNLVSFGYHPVQFISGLWKHEIRPKTFTLCVDNFGIKSYSQDDTDHLLNTLCRTYKISTHWVIPVCNIKHKT